VKLKMIFLFMFVFSFQSYSEKRIIYLEPGSCGDIFDIKEARDGITLPFFYLKRAFIKLGYELRVVSKLNNLHDAEKIICFNVPKQFKELSRYPKEKLLLFLWEPATVWPRNFEKQTHQYFSVVYTWKDDLIDNIKYFKFYYPQPHFTVAKSEKTFDEKRLSAMINCKKDSVHPFSLYGERRAVIRFFEKHPDIDFDLYGYGWHARDSKNFKGAVSSKAECLKNYRFCFCYENMKNVAGYVTEKIFDAFVSGCVPIYWGASNITDYVPQNCFIDRRNFKSNNELYLFLKNMSEDEHRRYLENIKSYLKSTNIQLFSIENFIDIVLSAIEFDYDRSKIFSSEGSLLFI